MAPVFVFPGEHEMEAIAAGILRVYRGEEKEKEYS
jgi:butyrate kinase